MRIVIADDQPEHRIALRDLLSTVAEIEIAGEATNGRETVDVTCAERPDITLMDIRMPVMNGIEATAAIRSRRRDAVVLVLTTFDDDRLIREAMAAGARGYLLKGTPLDEMLSVFGLALRGYTAIAKVRSAQEQRDDVFARLSNREREILALVGDGFTNRDIAERLCVTEGTVKNHLTHILATLRVKHRTQAALMWRSRT